MQKTDLYSFLKQQRLAVLSTLGPHHAPQSALVGYAVTPNLELIFDTIKTTRKYRNLILNQSCSLVAGWTGEQTVQFEGCAQELSPCHPTRYLAAYLEAWPECRSHLEWPDIVHFVVQPGWIRFSDYGQTPPLITEFCFEIKQQDRR